MDQIEYDDRQPWPVGADGAGPSLAKQDAYWTSADVTNWSASYRVAGTPGETNSSVRVLTPRESLVVPIGSSWRYHDAGTDLGVDWRQPNYVDTAWRSGPAIFYAGSEQATGNTVHVVALDPDGDAGISSTQSYSHVLDFGNIDTGANINGVKFTHVASAGLLTVPNVDWSNSSGIRAQGRPSGVTPLGGPLRELMQDYVLNSVNNANGTVMLVLKDLVPGTRYSTRIFARRADEAPRPTTFRFDPGGPVTEITLDQNSPDIPNPADPYVVQFDFAATTNQMAITAVQHTANRPWQWYALTNEVVQFSGQTELRQGPISHYFRHAFTYHGDRNADHAVRLRMPADDGAVVYLNGQEIHRANMPAGDIGYSTSAVRNVGPGEPVVLVDLPASSLVLGGPNVLAVEVHQAAGGNADLLFGAELSVIETPRPFVPPPRVLLNELGSSQDARPLIELANRDARPVDLRDLVLERHGSVNQAIALPNRSLGPGELITVEPSANGPRWAAGDRLVLYPADRSSVIDAQVLIDRVQGRSSNHQDRWLYPASATPGTVNSFSIPGDVVINEIMYHAPPRYATADQPYAESTEEWIELHNRGNQHVDLAGWSLSGGIEHVFPPGTLLAAGGYLVVANNVVTLRSKWPGVPIVGNFRGRLSDRSDQIVLLDTQGNPADEVRYYEGGPWPLYADGGGSSLELRDVRADNNAASSWAASREEEKAPWVTISYEGLAANPPGSQDPTEWHELVLGLLDAGEILIDDVSVIEDPHGTAIERMQNGRFEANADHWRFVGNHGQHGFTRVIVDPGNPNNHVLHVVATGATEHMSNHLETTFADGARIDRTKTYRISLRARWLSGSPQLHSRLYFNRLASTHILPQPASSGTPGSPNSQRIENVGPTFGDLRHSPVVPDANKPVVVSVEAADNDGLGRLSLFYAQDGQAFQSVDMRLADSGEFQATIPGHAAGRIVRFYVQGTDSRGAVNMFPAGGPDSRAMYRVNDQNATEGPRHNIRILMTSGDLSEMFTPTNYTSNERQGATVIWQESQVYYDVEVRLKGSGFSRGSGSTGFNLRFSPDRLLYGEHDVAAIDRTGGPWGLGASHRELTIKHIANRAGDIPMMYDDVIHLIGPRDSHNGSAQFLVARYDDVFLDSQYPNGSQGTRYKFELVYYSTLTANNDPEGLKLAPGSMRAGVFPVRGVDMPFMGEDPNAYRWHYLIRNNRDRDDFSRIIEMTKALRATGAELDTLSQAVMDVDQWMRVFAYESLAGINDTFNQGLAHNLQLFVRPHDQRVVPLPWDMDFSLHQPTNMAIYGTGSRIARLINLPTNRRLFQQHLWDIIQTTYNEEYLTPWVQHLATRSAQNNTQAILDYVRARRTFVLGRLLANIPFAITTPNKDNLTVDTAHVTLEGNGWIDVREIRRAGQSTPLPVKWLDDRRWQVTVPLQPGRQSITLLALDRQGNQVGTATATVTTSAASPLLSGLRVTEIHFNPGDPSSAESAAGWIDNDAFEFVEVTNVGQDPLDLTGLRFLQDQPDGGSEGIGFDFPSRQLAAGESLIVAANPAAFQARYGDAIRPSGAYAGQLANGGEQITLVGPGGEIIQQFAYDDGWYPAADGGGTSLEIRSASTTVTTAWNQRESWMASRQTGGTPGRAPQFDFNQDGRLSEQDIDLLCAALHGVNPRFDLDVDGDVDLDDLDYLVVSAMRSRPGDANLDGRFDTADLVWIIQRGEFEDGLEGNSKWSDGDWDCDGDFTTADLVFALQYGGFETG
jgi:hypothetical protein